MNDLLLFGGVAVLGVMALAPLFVRHDESTGKHWNCRFCGIQTGPLQKGVCDRCIAPFMAEGDVDMHDPSIHGVQQSALECPSCHKKLHRAVDGGTVSLWCGRCDSDACREGSTGTTDVDVLRRIAAELHAERWAEKCS